MKAIIFMILIAAFASAQGQQTLHIRTLSAIDRNPVAATIGVKGLRTITADSLGTAVLHFPDNNTYLISVSSVGFQLLEKKIKIPSAIDTLIFELEPEEHELSELIIQSTRTSRNIRNVPTRVETIEFEEIDEKNNMRPGNVAMLLHESTGIQVQQTSATSGNASIRIQGLDGRYTQLLKDGVPNFGNFSSGLSVLEIPPLDLSQVEIIKGPASPLYGGGAIAGVVNFISKTPKEAPERNFLLNYSNIGQFNAGAFLAAKKNQVGYTMLALYSRQKTYDVDGDDFTEVPKTEEITLYPKVYFYLKGNATLMLGNSFTWSDRKGGDKYVVDGKADPLHQYFEQNETKRNISTVELDKKIGSKKRLLARQSLSVFDRAISVPGYGFSGISYNSFTDVSFISNKDRSSMVIGANLTIDNFNERITSAKRDYTLSTAGIYGQHTWDANEYVKLETGLRVDFANYRNAIFRRTEVLMLPRLSLLIRYNSHFTSRIGAGMGYKAPTIFTERTETIQYRGISQLNQVSSEKSYGGTADLNYTTRLGANLSLSANQLIFYTAIQKPLVLEPVSAGIYEFHNAVRPVRSAGSETNVKLIYRNSLKLFAGYTYTNARSIYLPGKPFLPLVPKSKLNTALIYEKEESVKLGLEGYFTGRQTLSDGSRVPAYSEFGFMAEKIFKRFSLYINFENFTDTRQSRYESVVNGSHLDPSFDEIWTHTEGFVVNGGIKLKL